MRQIAALEAKVKELERARRRSQRLLLMTRRVIAGLREKRIGSTQAWQRSFAELEEEDDAAPRPASTPTPDWRERALSWERKLTGADEGEPWRRRLHGAAGDAPGAAGALRGDDGGDVGGRSR